MKTKKAVINVSPLCDVTFTVLMTLMVTVPIIAVSGKIKVDLPECHTVEQRDEKALNVTIPPLPPGDTTLQSYRIAIGDIDVTFEEGLKILEDEIQKDPDRMILIRADKYVLYGDVLTLLRFATGRGAKRIAVATAQKGGGK